jgi:hypothetical protein
MNEYILAILPLDKAKSLAFAKPHHFTVPSAIATVFLPSMFRTACQVLLWKTLPKPHRYGEGSIFQRVLKRTT